MRNNNQSQLVPRQPGYGSLAVGCRSLVWTNTFADRNQHICRYTFAPRLSM